MERSHVIIIAISSKFQIIILCIGENEVMNFFNKNIHKVGNTEEYVLTVID